EASVARLATEPWLLGRLEYHKCATLDLMGREEAADAACAKARSIFEAHEGAEGLDVANVLIIEARLAITRGRLAAARGAAERALAIREHSLGKDHPSLTEALFVAGQVAAHDGRLADA